MAKTIKCALCGKEIVKGFLSGNSEVLDVGEFNSIDCCEECYAKYKPLSKVRKARFDAKLHNMLRAKKIKKPDNEFIGKLYVEYCEAEEQIPDIDFRQYNSFYAYNPDGTFSVNEYKLGFMNQDGSASSMIKSMKNNIVNHGKPFTKNDITKIEYRRVGTLGVSLGLFKSAYSYEIRLNDESVMSYVPAITRTTVLATYFPLFKHIKADKNMREIMEQFRHDIGTDIPAVQVKKFQ